MLITKQLTPRHKAKTREYLRKWYASAAILSEARALARSGRFGNHAEIGRELDRLSGSERAREWFQRFELQAQLDTLCHEAMKRSADRKGPPK